MSRALQLTAALSIASIVGVWGLAVLGHKLFLHQLTEDFPASEMTDEQLDRFLGDLHQIAERGYLPEATRERDAGALLNRYMSMDSSAGEADERAWWSDREASDALKAIEGGWEENPTWALREFGLSPEVTAVVRSSPWSLDRSAVVQADADENRFALADSKLHTGLLDKFPRVKAWLEALLAHDAVKGSLPDEFEETFVANLKRNEYYLGTLFETESAAAE